MIKYKSFIMDKLQNATRYIMTNIDLGLYMNLHFENNEQYYYKNNGLGEEWQDGGGDFTEQLKPYSSFVFTLVLFDDDMDGISLDEFVDNFSKCSQNMAKVKAEILSIAKKFDLDVEISKIEYNEHQYSVNILFKVPLECEME